MVHTPQSEASYTLASPVLPSYVHVSVRYLLHELAHGRSYPRKQILLALQNNAFLKAPVTFGEYFRGWQSFLNT